jgi:hypothetical protein
MSTFHALQAKGIRIGDTVVTPQRHGQTLAKVKRLYFGHAIVAYPNHTLIGWPPDQLTKATPEQAATYARTRRQCSNCQHWRDDGDGAGHCAHHQRPAAPDDYCAVCVLRRRP